MIKVSMLAALLGGLAMGSTTIAATQVNKSVEPLDTQIIVEVDRSLGSLTKEGVKNVQNIVYNRIKSYVTPNIKFITSYSVLNNAFAISINSNYVERVKSLPGVKSVTINKVRLVTQSVNQILSDDEVDPVNDYGGKINQSAVTMNHDPYDEHTNNGEGTVIAVLDNEFYFRAKNSENNGFYHETFTDLDASVKVRWTDRPDITETHAYSPEDNENDNARWHAIVDAAKKGEEGSLYFNKKIPFYFDYGGDPEYTGSDPLHDFDVSSTSDYHGSHVSSIATGNSPYYKGIAPKAQLVAMKVFTNFKASKTDQALGFQGGSGAYDIPLLNALEDCITLGVDGINMSLGSNLDDFDAESISMKTISKLVNSGILTSISAGNAGKSSYGFAGGYGNWTSHMVETGILGGYANQVDGMSIASGQPAQTFFASAFKMNGINISYQDQVVNVGGSYDYEEDEEHRISDLVEGKASKTLEWTYIPNFGESGDYDGREVRDRIAVINRGKTAFSDKVKLAKEKGAIGVIIINNDPTANDFNFRCSFGEDKPTIPVALILMKEKTKFSEDPDGHGVFDVVKDEIDVNPTADTLSSFSSDGATFNLDLKPEITAPGDYIRGAVPPQSKDDKRLRPLSTYEFLSGTSMSAPNYAGAQSVVLSKRANELKNKPEELLAFKNTVNMRLMSTATPMKDYAIAPEINPDYPLEVEGNEHQYEEGYYGYISSPRIQGAGMANIGNAYNTSVYLEGLDLNGNPIQKSKIALRNGKEINEGNISLKFLAHNESESVKKYTATFTVMRPAIKASNEIVARNYNYNHVEIDSITNFPGYSYWSERVDPDTGEISIVENHCEKPVNINDVYKVSREIKYNIKGTDPVTGEDILVEQTIPVGMYCCTEIIDEKVVDPTTGKKWIYAKYEILESRDYQSTQDVMIKTSLPFEVEVPAKSTTEVVLPTVSLTNEEKAKILKFFSYGTYLEGFVTLKSKNNDGIDLSMPWMGFFGGEGQTYESAPIAEPFSFEKDSYTVYPSELVNDIGYSLLAKSNIDMGSTWITTYVEPGKEFDSENILKNDNSLSNLVKFDPEHYHLLGTDLEGRYYEDPSKNLYVGNPVSSNTMIVQQFMLRSVDDNYYTIKNKASGQVVAKDVLKDMLFGDRYGRYPLYKSHVDENYLGAGYIAHRAWAVIPLYDSNGYSFPAGDYEITFNYLLAGTANWVAKTYTLHVCSNEPSIDNVIATNNSIRFHYNDDNIASVTVGKYYYEMSEAEKAGHYIELSKERVIRELQDNFNRVWRSGRLFIKFQNKAYGSTGVIVRFEKDDNDEPILNKYVIVEHYSLSFGNDFEDLGDSVNTVTVAGNQIRPFDVDEYLRVKRYNDPVPPSGGGCGGNITTTSILLASLAGALALILMLAKKRRKLGGKE